VSAPGVACFSDARRSAHPTSEEAGTAHRGCSYFDLTWIEIVTGPVVSFRSGPPWGFRSVETTTYWQTSVVPAARFGRASAWKLVARVQLFALLQPTEESPGGG
jgi:hypothetical protein